MDGLGLHHIHVRQRLARGLEPFPSKNVVKRAFDYLMYGVGVTQPLILVPQIKTIYIDHITAGVSVTTWALAALFNTLWVGYSLIHGNRILLTSCFLMLVLDLVIVYGALRAV